MKYFTSYYANWRSFPDKTLQISISNSTPTLDHVITQMKPVVPDWNTLVGPSKRGILNWDDYKLLYNQQLDKEFDSIKRIFHELELNLSDKYDNIVFLCYCKKSTKCHRSLFAEWVKTHLNIEIKELN